MKDFIKELNDVTKEARDKALLDEINRVTKEVIYPRVLEMKTPFRFVPVTVPLPEVFIFGANGSVASLKNVGPPETSLPPIQPLNPRRMITYEDGD